MCQAIKRIGPPTLVPRLLGLRSMQDKSGMVTVSMYVCQ